MTSVSKEKNLTKKLKLKSPSGAEHKVFTIHYEGQSPSHSEYVGVVLALRVHILAEAKSVFSLL